MMRLNEGHPDGQVPAHLRDAYMRRWRAERERLWSEFGRPRTLPRDGAVLRMLTGCDLDPKTAYVASYPDEGYAAAACWANRELHGHRVWGPEVTESGVLVVVDYSAAVAAARRRAGL